MANDIIDSLNIIEENIDKDKIKIETVLYFHDDSPVFEGHFPQYKILAGAYQLLIAKYYIQRLLDTNIIIKKIKRAKFLSLIKENDIFKMRIDYQNNNNYKLYNFKLVMEKENNVKVGSCSLTVELY